MNGEASLRSGIDPSWWLAIGGLALIAMSMAITWQSLPSPMAVQWSTDGEITNTMPKLAWAALWSGAWVLVSSGLVALRAPHDWRRVLLIAVLGVLVAGYVTTLVNNFGAASWHEAGSLNLSGAAACAVAASGGIWVVDRALGR